MKNALILHGTDGYPEENWFSWLTQKLQEKAYHVWVPQLPQANKPSITRYNELLLHNDWSYNTESYIIGHSSGAVAALGLLQQLPENIIIDTCILVGAFINDLGWDALKKLFNPPFDFEKIKQHAKRFINRLVRN
jgi:predicted alpha/beta hydrolase family esterase